MKIEIVAAKRSRAHIRYKLKNGELVPGVTTVINQLNKPSLAPWYGQLGLRGIDPGPYVRTLGMIGTITHEMILADLQNVAFDIRDIASDMLAAAEWCFSSYLKWKKLHVIEPILCEIPLVSQEWKFGGTVDFYGKVDGVLTLRDFKTGNDIWPEHWYQLAAYRMLLQEAGHTCDTVAPLNIPRTEDDEYGDPPPKRDTTVQWAIFWHLLQIYKLRKSVP